jgi:hypothetical protein
MKEGRKEGKGMDRRKTKDRRRKLQKKKGGNEGQKK